jgi:hypothetical protein
MRKIPILCPILFSLWSVALAQDATVTLPRISVNATNTLMNPSNAPTWKISAADVVQESIRVLSLGTNWFAVRWTYTEDGAKKAMAFWDAHPSPNVTPSSEWKKGWMKWRTDKCIFKTSAAANTFAVQLRSK